MATKKRAVNAVSTTVLGGRYNDAAADSSGGIVPGSHPEYQNMHTGFDIPNLTDLFPNAGMVSDAQAKERGTAAFRKRGGSPTRTQRAISKRDLGY
jgi:hypothetical protein